METIEQEADFEPSQSEGKQFLETTPPSSETLVTERDNRYYGYELGAAETKIVETLKQCGYPISPSTIASKSEINPNSVRTFLKRLKRKGIVSSPHRGLYLLRKNSVTLEGVGCQETPRVHRVTFRIMGFGVGLGSAVLADNKYYKVTLVPYSNCSMVFVDCRGTFSFDYPGFLGLTEFVRSCVGNPADDDIMVVGPEVNNDYYGISLYGSKCVAFTDFKGNFERIYQKGNVLRSEARINGTYPIEEIYMLLKGGMPAYQILQSVGFLSAKLDQLIETMKHHNELDVRIGNFLKALLDRSGKECGSQ